MKRWRFDRAERRGSLRLTAPFSTETGRLEAFSDGVIAVIITVMVLDLKPPHGTDFTALRPVFPTLAAYILSFVFTGIYWNNHHHMLRASSGIDGRSMWANLHLLFWLSLAPFTTAWLGEHPTSAVPTAVYGIVLLLDAIAYTVLQYALLAVNGTGTAFAAAVQTDLKSRISPLLYLCAIGLAFVSTPIADALFVLVALIWVVPERRFERVIHREGNELLDAPGLNHQPASNPIPLSEPVSGGPAQSAAGLGPLADDSSASSRVMEE